MSAVPPGTVVPLVRSEDVDLGKDIQERIWLFDAPWLRFLAVVMRPRRAGRPIAVDVFVGIDDHCPHTEREVRDVVLQLLHDDWEGETLATTVVVRRGSAR